MPTRFILCKHEEMLAQLGDGEAAARAEMGDDLLDGHERVIGDDVDLEAVARRENGGLGHSGALTELFRGELPLGLWDGQSLADVDGGGVVREPHDYNLSERRRLGLLLWGGWLAGGESRGLALGSAIGANGGLRGAERAGS